MRSFLVGQCLMGLIVCLCAPAQETYVIDTDGVATVDAAPDAIVFALELAPKGSSHVELLKAATDFENKVRSEIQDKGLTPAQMTFSGLNYTHPEKLGPNTRCELRFNVTPYVTGEDAPGKLAELHDTITALAMTTGASLSAPAYVVNDPGTVEAAAIGRAVEKAYPAAKAVADVMNARILTVADVRVTEVEWSSPQSPPAEYNIRRVTCTARLHVAYFYAPNI